MPPCSGEVGCHRNGQLSDRLGYSKIVDLLLNSNAQTEILNKQNQLAVDVASNSEGIKSRLMQGGQCPYAVLIESNAYETKKFRWSFAIKEIKI